MARTGNVILALMAGIAVGVGAGILLAPDKGKNTRDRLKKSVGDSVDKLKEQLENISERISHKSSEINENFEEKVENLLSKSSYKAEEVITILEKKLAALKQANAKFQK